MANETIMTIVGGLTADPEYRSHDGVEYANFSVASTPRTFDRQTNEWKDGDTLYLPCSVSGALAENMRTDYFKGTQVIIVGELRQQTWVDRETNQNRSRMALKVQEIAIRTGRSRPRPIQDQGNDAWSTPSNNAPWAQN